MPPHWQARLLTLPGVLTLLSLLAVLLGAPPPTADGAQRQVTGNTAPGLPELRPAPPPAPPAPLLASPPPEVFRPAQVPPRHDTRPRLTAAVPDRPDLVAWGRLQTDGG